MDPKTVSSLDPKLKEVYDRVMGTASPTSSPPPQTTPTPAITTPVAPTNISMNGLAASSFPKYESPSLTQAPAQSNTPPKPDLQTQPQSSVTRPVSLASPMPQAPGGTNNLSMSPEPAHTTPPAPTSPLGKPIVDYAALAAKYATPTPPVGAMGTAHAPVVTPSSTTYGVVNSDPGKTEKKGKGEKTEVTTEAGSSKKKILLIVGLPLLIIVYAAVWTFIFHVDIMSFLPLPK